MSMKLAALVAGVALAAGCATPQVTEDDLNAVRAIAEGAQSTATEAQRVANQARQTAQTASSTANQALSAAQDAQACCDATNQRMDRMFEDLQSK